MQGNQPYPQTPQVILALVAVNKSFPRPILCHQLLTFYGNVFLKQSGPTVKGIRVCRQTLPPHLAVKLPESIRAVLKQKLDNILQTTELLQVLAANIPSFWWTLSIRRRQMNLVVGDLLILETKLKTYLKSFQRAVDDHFCLGNRL